MQIKGTITGLRYRAHLSKKLKKFNIKKFDINQAPPSFVLKDSRNRFGVSKWVSPKRSRSYPFERVYNTLHISKKITIIPVVKDEGMKGDRDFIQWDTVSLMSLIDVYVILAYYDKAKVHPRDKEKITHQQFNNDYILSKIKEIKQYRSSALHWNLNEINKNLYKIMDQVKISYSNIQRSLNVRLHNPLGLTRFKNQISKDIADFIEFSRKKALRAQSNEYRTIQPRKIPSTLSKAKITIFDYLGGQYFLTVDEIVLTPKKVFLVEVKYSKDSILSSKSSIKDRLLKMILYANLTKVTVNDEKLESKGILKLSSPKLIGKITCKSTSKEILKFFDKNCLSPYKKNLVQEIIQEAKSNKFNLEIAHSKW